MAQPNESTSTVDLVRANFSFLAPNAHRVVERFYEILFSRYPQAKPLFANTDMARQRDHLIRALVLTVDNIDNPETLGPVLAEMGKRHAGYGVEPEHYGMVADSLIAALAELSGDGWTPDTEAAWKAALGQVASIMLEGVK